MGLLSSNTTMRTKRSGTSKPIAPLLPSSDPELNPGSKRRVLFVEANLAVPEEFNRVLQKRSRSWDIAAAPNATEAMALLENKTFDGVVASARLPGGTGVEFLNQLTRRFPNVVRLIRYAPEDKPLLRGFLGWPPCHLTRDMDDREMESGLEGAFQVAAWMASPSIQALLSQVLRLPTMPEIYDQVLALLASPDSSITDVGELIARDPALTAKMLQMVNSAAFGLAHPVASAVDAVLYFGAERTKALLLVANTSLRFDLSGCE